MVYRPCWTRCNRSVRRGDVGTYRVTTTVVDVTLTGSEVVTVTIAPKPVTIAVSASDKQYDATTDAAITFQLDGVIDGDDVAVDAAKVSGAFATADAFPDQIVTISADSTFLAGADAANYTASMPSEAAASIVRAPQGVWFSSVVPASMSTGSTYTPGALSSMGLVVALSLESSANGICSFSGAVVTARAAGVCIVVASQPGTANIEAAWSVSQRITVGVVEASHGAVGSAPDVDTRGTDGQSVSGSVAGVEDDAGHPIESSSGATTTGSGAAPTGADAAPTDTGATCAGGAVDSNGQTDSPVGVAAVAAARDDHQVDWPLVLLPLLAIALLGGGFFYFFIAGKRRWRGREG